jgi:hypothetical protein
MVFHFTDCYVQSLWFFLGLFPPPDAAESIYPAENADTVYQALEVMPQFWKQASITDEHLLTMYALNNTRLSCV